MTVRGLREKYLAFFVSKGHVQFPSGSLIPYDVTGRLDESLLFNGAGMVQFKPYFRGVAQPENRRLTTTQKCMRTGDIESVGDDTHLTFFEMLGNFSFGDYFKTEAIDFSWEFLTSPDWLGLDPRRLSFTIFEDDEVAFAQWGKHLSAVGLNPERRIFRLTEESNYWPAGSLSAGPPGPCGPNSEMFYWVQGFPPDGPYGSEDFLADDARGAWVEIWNDVFITSEWQGHLRNPLKPTDGYEKEGMPDLPFKSIDTGMGLERTAMVLGGYSTVYESDAFVPIFERIRALAGDTTSPEKTIAERVIADHIRTASFCIADGVFPSNGGRGYVLRRLIRRAVLKGARTLGLSQPFFADIFLGVLESMGDFYRELQERKATIMETLANEEAQFRKTLQSGATLLEQELRELKPGGFLSGAVAFRLYDTFGFPLEITLEIASEQGFGVDQEGYEAEMVEAQVRSRSGQTRQSVYGGLQGSEEWISDGAPSATDFVGYDEATSSGRVVRVRRNGEAGLLVSLDRTPLYAESGGQVGDQGTIRGEGLCLSVVNTTKSQGVFWHEVVFEGDPESLREIAVTAGVEGTRRRSVQRNHTATHLLHAALREVLGTHVAQAGSFVGPDGLRFDFSHHHAMTAAEVSAVEQQVNSKALENLNVHTYVDLPIDEARAKGAMALFGEKYGDRVRMVEIGDFSRELCGGTHVRTTGEIGLFKITSESSAASGVRRIEAMTGDASYRWVIDEWSKVREASALLRTTPNLLISSVERVLDQLKDERKKREKAELALLRTGPSENSDGDLTSLRETVAGITVWVKNFGEANPKMVAGELDNVIAADPNSFGLVGAIADGKPILYAKAGLDAVGKGAHSGNLVRAIASQLGGSGGGRAEFASAGGKDATQLNSALRAVPEIVAGMIRA